MPKPSAKSSSRTRGKPARVEPSSFEREHFFGSTVVGERGQLVIPKDIREKAGILPGMKLMVVHHADGPILLFPVDQVKVFMRHALKEVRKVV